jgi:predicted DCC family thiol-disulfide oxidoreductase YuxK
MPLDAQSAAPPHGRARAGKFAVIFDGACPKCRKSIKGLQALADPESLETIDLQDPDLVRRFPNLRRDELLREIHVIDDTGQIWRGADAIRETLSRQHGVARVLSWLWRIPGLGRFAEHEYRRIAATRHRENGHAHSPVT